MKDTQRRSLSPHEPKQHVEQMFRTLRKMAQEDHERRCTVSPAGHLSLRAFCECDHTHMGSCMSPLCTLYRQFSDAFDASEQERQEAVCDAWADGWNIGYADAKRKDKSSITWPTPNPHESTHPPHA